MAILILNVGSQTVKWAVFDRRWEEGLKEDIKSFDSEIRKILSHIRKKHSISIVAHRVVHGGKLKDLIINSNVLEYLKSLKGLAPLHQENEIKGIGISMKLFPKAKHVAVFDTSFFSELPEKAKIYAIPLSFYEKGVRKYGFHGSSHEFIVQKLGRKFSKIISCHLGAGCSIAAIKNSRPIDTSMGFTPLEGVMMMTRSGSIDPGIIFYLGKRYGLKEAEKIINEKSGICGISGLGDFRKVLRSKDKKAKLAIEIFCYSIAKQIGAYAAVLEGVDAVVFTGGIGEHSEAVRKKIINYIKFLKPRVFVIKADEKEIMLKKARKL